MKLVGYNSQMETTIDSLRSIAFLLVGFFARARALVLAVVVVLAVAIGLAACGGGGGGGGDVGDGGSAILDPIRRDGLDPTIGGGDALILDPMAYFHGAARVEGLQYQYEDGGSGETDARGGFPIEQGKTVVFSVGITPLGTVEFSSDVGRDFVTPSRIVGNSGDQMEREMRALRIERLLIALDDDNDDDNGIKIQAAALASTENLLTIAALDTLSYTGRIEVGSVVLHIPDETQARQALARTNNCAYSGVFAGNFGTEDVAIVLMPNLNATLTVNLNPKLVLANASPIVSFIGEDVSATVLAIDLKTPPLTVILQGGAATMTLASYDRIQFSADGDSGAVRRVTGDPNADHRLAGIDGVGDFAFVADIFDGGNAQISSIGSPNAQNLLSAEHEGEFPTGSGETRLTLRAGGDSATLALRANPNIFFGAGNNEDFGGTWCEL